MSESRVRENRSHGLMRGSDLDDMVEILWHWWETNQKTEKTNLNLNLVYLTLLYWQNFKIYLKLMFLSATKSQRHKESLRKITFWTVPNYIITPVRPEQAVAEPVFCVMPAYAGIS